MVICYRWLEGGSGFIRLLPAGPDGQPVLPAGRLWLRVERVCLGEGNGQEAGTQVAAGLVLDGSLGHAQAAPSDADQLTVPLRGCELPVELAPRPEGIRPSLGLALLVDHGKSDFTIGGLVGMLLEEAEVVEQLALLSPQARQALADKTAPALGRLAALLAFVEREGLRPGNIETLLREHRVAAAVLHPQLGPASASRGGLVVLAGATSPAGGGQRAGGGEPVFQAGSLRVLGSNFTLYHGVQGMEFFEACPYFVLSFAGEE